MQKSYHVENFYKKMDSTLRGHLSEEILGVIEQLGLDCAVIAPAYPEEGRMTVGGYQLVHGQPVELTEVARDPLFPVGESHLPTMLSEASREEIVGHIELGTVLHGAGPILQELTELIEAGKRLIVVDACSAVDLDQVALSLRKIQKSYQVLPCGSAGLGKALAKYWVVEQEEESEEEANRLPDMPDEPVLIVNGSSTEKSRLQIERLGENYEYYGKGSQYQRFVLRPEVLLGLEPFEETIEEVVKGLKKGDTVAITSSVTEETVADTSAYADEKGLSEIDVSAKVEETMSQMTKAILDEVSAKLVTIGGETSSAIFETIETREFTVTAEMETSIPLLVENLDNGKQRWIVTKSGNFGVEMSLANIVKSLREEVKASTSTKS